MRITFKLYAALSDYLPLEARASSTVHLDVEEGTTPLALIERFALPLNMCHLVLVNGVFVEPAQRGKRLLAEDDVVAIWPPIAGG